MFQPLAIAAATVLFALPFAAAAQGTEAVDSFIADITVQADGHVLVQERIDYFFPTDRHGIYRIIPDTYVDENGTRSVVPFTIVSVTDGAGAALAYEEESFGAARRIRIGDADTTLRGARTYVITYDVAGAVRYFDDHDELYWNVTGTGWDVPIRSAAAVVRLPEGVVAPDIQTRCFTGAQGSIAEECSASVRDGVATYGAAGNLTIVAGWPKGHVAVLQARRIGALGPVASLWPLVIPIATFVFLYRRWRKTGRDIGAATTLVVQYDPPESARPADVGVIIDETAKTAEITATIVDLAVRGYLRIREIEKKAIFNTKPDFEFVQTVGDRSADAALKPYERSILDVLFGSVEKSVTMSALASRYAFESQLESIKRQIYDESVHLGYFTHRPDDTRSRYRVLGVAAALLLGGGGFLLGTIGLGYVPVVAGLLTAAILFGFAPLMAQKTALGSAAADHARGFKLYLSRAEKYRLRWQEQEKLFEAFLPYAMVFGVVDKYTKAFAAIGLTPSSSGWYEGPAAAGGRFNAALFAGSMSSFGKGMSSAVTSVQPSKTSSGSGFSGGSSGGGFGGGGGGSW